MNEIGVKDSLKLLKLCFGVLGSSDRKELILMASTRSLTAFHVWICFLLVSPILRCFAQPPPPPRTAIDTVSFMKYPTVQVSSLLSLEVWPLLELHRVEFLPLTDH